ncbi:MAG: type II toxin-antitoxin system VapC family toxin [Burkholderiaceae bacterium]|nr:type II toxin-antitoxin system VapC family toxin [Rhodoferax sp.]MCP5260897.1 type II toxin-antitoxin system VapC family toxin [Rhodoferax sp.]MCW5642347.1 type II toxin-antitoxin system VapC family toxin [Rhodoferax sp.]
MTGEWPGRARTVAAAGVDLAVASASGLRVMLDASALLKRYASEAGHERVLDVFAQADGLLVAAHCQSEMAAALLRRRRDGCLSEAEFERVWAAARRDVADMVRVPLDDHVERFAFAAMEHEPLRVTDALHVGSALAANVDLFVTADRRLAQVAQLLGLPAECLEATAAMTQEEGSTP